MRTMIRTCGQGACSPYFEEGWHDEQDYEARMADILNMEMAQCVEAFDYLPIEQDAALLRNILYSGVWSRYAYLQQKRKEKKQ